MALISSRRFRKNLGNLKDFFGQMVYRPPWQKISRTPMGDDETENSEIKHFRRMRLVSNVLFVIENIIMILLFYFSHFPHTWYSLPVTICVCLFAVLGAVIRLTHFYFLKKDSDDQVPLDRDFNPVVVEA